MKAENHNSAYFLPFAPFEAVPPLLPVFAVVEVFVPAVFGLAVFEPTDLDAGVFEPAEVFEVEVFAAVPFAAPFLEAVVVAVLDFAADLPDVPALPFAAEDLAAAPGLDFVEPADLPVFAAVAFAFTLPAPFLVVDVFPAGVLLAAFEVPADFLAVPVVLEAVFDFAAAPVLPVLAEDLAVVFDAADFPAVFADLVFAAVPDFEAEDFAVVFDALLFGFAAAFAAGFFAPDFLPPDVISLTASAAPLTAPAATPAITSVTIFLALLIIPESDFLPDDLVVLPLLAVEVVFFFAVDFLLSFLTAIIFSFDRV